ncbi:MAG: ATP-binding cassette domain-containing protein [Holosporales bacterium]|jgi:putative ABC transport system ATP-binding protein|nr:ATP-binding cassette domain-containing protein [Holosporales bacterium]
MLRLRNINVRNTLRNLCLTVRDGEFVLIIGANGSGKTTLFNVISGIIQPRSGEVSFKNQDITNIPQHRRTKWISTVLQDPRSSTVGEMTILENMILAYMRNSCRKVSRSTINYFREKLSILGMNLENRLGEYVKSLSGGQRQALSLVMATISDYELLLLDEITSALDPKNSDMIMEMTEKIIDIEKKACLLITHNVKHIKSFNARILEMNNGQLEEAQAVAALDP